MGQISKLSLCVTIIFIGLSLVSSERRVIGRDPFDTSKTGDNGWRPLPGTSDRPMFSKEAVGHPVLDKLKAHIEAAEKQQLLYTPPPPTILGSFSAVSRPRKEVYSARLVPPPPPPSSLDLQGSQQQQHAFFLAPPTHTLLPPPRSSDFLVDNGYFNQQRFPSVGHLQFFPQLKPGVQEAFSVLPQHQYRDPLQQTHSQIGLGQQDFGSIFRQQETTSTVSPHGNNQGPTRDQNFYVTPPVTGHRFETKRPVLPNIFSEPQIIQGQVTSSRFPQPPTYQQLYNAGQSGHAERNPNSATSVVGFTLGVSPDNQVSTKTTIQHRPQGTAEVDLTHGQRTRVTRPYFGEDAPTASIPQQRPQITDSDAHSLLSTVPPVPQAFLRKPPNTAEQQTQNSDDSDHRRPSHRPRRPPQRPVLETENSYGDQTVTTRPRYPSQQQPMIFVTALSDDYSVTPASVQYSQPDVTETYSQQTRRPTNQRPNTDFQNVNTDQQSVDFYGKVEIPSRPLKRPGIKKRPQVITNGQDEEQSTYKEEKPVQDYRTNHQTSGPGSSLVILQNNENNNGQIIQAHKQETDYKNILQGHNSYQLGTDQHIRLQETVTTDQRIVDDQSRYHDAKITQTDRPYQQFPKGQSHLDAQTQHQSENVGNRVRPSELLSDNLEQQPQYQNERKRYKGRRPQHQSAHSSVGNEEVKPTTEYSHNLPAGNNEIRTRKRRPKPTVKNQEDSTLHSPHQEEATQVTDFDNPENVIQTSSYESQPIQEHRKYRRPLINKPQLEHTTPVDVYDNQDKSQRHRRPLTHKRIRPTEEVKVKEYENQEIGTQPQPGLEYNEGHTNNYENQDIIYRKRQKHPQRVKEMVPSAVDETAESDYTPQFSTAEALSTTVSSPVYRPRQNPYNRNRGNEKYKRKPLNDRTTTRQPEINHQLTQEEWFPATEPEIPNDLTDESPTPQHPSVTIQNYGFTSRDEEEEDVPISTTEALTTTTVSTTTTSTTPVPHVSSSMTTINRLRPKLRYGTSNYTRPRFSVKDYRERLKQSQTSASTAKPGDENDALDSSITEAPSSERSRTPRPRGAYHYKPHRTDDVDQSDVPKVSKYRPKDLSRLNSARYRSTTTTTAAPYTTEKSESGYKSSTSRYRRPVTGKYNSHYRASTEQSATSRMDEELPAEIPSTTSRPVYRPKGVFSAAMRRPFPLRTSNSPPTEATADNAIAESDGSQTLSKTDSTGDEETVVAPTSIYGMKANLDVVTTTTPTAEVIEADPTPSSSPPLEIPTEQSSPSSQDEATTTLDVSSTVTDSVLPQTSSVVPAVVIEADLGTVKHEEQASTPWDEDGISPSQRVADLTSSATLGGYFQTSSNANIKNSLRITMATEDPILPLEAFFPSWGNKDSEASR